LDKISAVNDNTNNNSTTDNNNTHNRRVRELLLYRSNIKKDSTSARILEMSYDYHSNSNGISELLSDVSKRIGKPYRFTKKIVLELKYSGYLESRQRGRYSITQKGRWFALCQKLDGISFLSLCLLAETYHRVKSNPEFFYQLSAFREYYQRDCTNDAASSDNVNSSSLSAAIYHRTNISKSLHHLTSRNLVYVVSGDFIKMAKPTIEFLRTYDDDLESLFLWCGDTYEKYVDHIIDNNELGLDIRMISIPKGPN